MWLEEALRGLRLDQEMEEYLLGRGGPPELIKAMGLVTWEQLSVDVPYDDFCAKYGRRGEGLVGALITPLYSPRSRLLGFEARSIRKKKLSRFVLPEANWNPVWIGIREAMPKIWAGGTVWVVEGIFDLFAMRRIIPKRDAVLSSLQARLTDNHLQFISRFVPTVNMVYDRDEAGRRATKRGMFRLRQLGVPCRDLVYSGGKDPGQIWEERGEDVLRETFAIYL